MQVEIESVTSNGGWMVFGALVAWIGLILEGRTRKLSTVGSGKAGSGRGPGEAETDRGRDRGEFGG